RVSDRFHTWHTLADGTLRHYDIRVDPIPEGILVLGLDDTVAAQREAELRTAHDRFRLFFDRAPFGLVEVDTVKSIILQVNDRYCEVLGRTREQLTTQSWKTFTHPDDLQGDQETVDHMLRTGQPVTRDKRYLKPDGSIVYARLTLTPLWRPGEPPTRHLTAIEDKSAERAARETLVRKDAELQATSRALGLHHRVRAAILQARTEAELFTAVCTAFVANAGYRMSWVGIPEQDA